MFTPVMSMVLVVATVWIAYYALAGDEALPGSSNASETSSILLLLTCGGLLGALVTFARVPAAVGAALAGIVM